MNRYLIRAFVAILTFCIGVAVGSLRPRSTNPRELVYNYSGKTFERDGCRRRPRIVMAMAPAVTVDTAFTDPARLTYSSTTTNGDRNPFLQNVELLVENTGDREIRNVTVGFVATRSSGDYHSGSRSGWKVVDSEDKSAEATVSIESGVDEALIAWISAIEFKDGSRWVNPRHDE